MKRTPWFERVFPPITDNGVFPSILERLEGTPARLSYKFKSLQGTPTKVQPDQWSMHKEVGHLIDLEPLWYERALQIIDNQSELIKADLSNRKTHEADHDDHSLPDLIERFETARVKLMKLLRQLSEADLEKSAVHPRLGTPMKLIDLAFFVAEHDDHHLAQITSLGGAIKYK